MLGGRRDLNGDADLAVESPMGLRFGRTGRDLLKKSLMLATVCEDKLIAHFYRVLLGRHLEIQSLFHRRPQEERERLVLQVFLVASTRSSLARASVLYSDAAENSPALALYYEELARLRHEQRRDDDARIALETAEEIRARLDG